MSNKDNTKQHALKKSTRNKAVLFGAGAVIALGGIVYAVNSNSSQDVVRTMAQPVNVTKKDVEVKDSNIGFQKDELGLTQSSTKLKELEQERYEDVVKQKVLNGETDIVERRDPTRRIEYTPHNTGLDVIEVKTVQQEIDVPNINLTPLAKPEMVVANEEPSIDYTPDYIYTPAQYNSASATQPSSLAQAISTYSQQGVDKGTPSKGAVDFTGMDNFRQALKDTQPKEQNTAVSADTTKTQQISASTSNNQLTAYKTSATVMKSDTQSSMYPLIKMGQIESAYTTLAANNKNMGPIQAVLTSGEYAGATLIGTVSSGNEALNFNFTEMYLPNSTKRVAIHAIALKADTLEVGTYTNIDKKWAARIGKSILRGAVEFGSYYANEGTTTTTSSSTVTTSQKSRSAAEKVALGGIADEISSDVEAIDTAVEITQERYSPIKVMFMSEVQITDETQSSSGTLERNSQTPSYVESRAEAPSRETRHIVPTNNGYNNVYGNNGYNRGYPYAPPTPVQPIPAQPIQPTESVQPVTE